MFCFILLCFQSSAYLTSSNSNPNVVRVAPRQKYPTINNQPINTATPTPPTGFSSSTATQFPIQSFNYINYQTQQRIPNTISYDKQSAVAKTNPFLVKGGLERTGPDKQKYNTLTKALTVHKSPQFYSMRKSKRNHSAYTGPVDTTGSSNCKLASLLDYDQPLYENLTDSIQIHEELLPGEDTSASLIKFNNPDSDTNSSGNNNSGGKRNHPFNSSGSGGGTNNKERMSIHRSDSGISNSSYECLPQTTPRIHPQAAAAKNKRYHLTTPVYINVPYNVSSSTNNTFNAYTTNRLSNDNDSNEVSVLRLRPHPNLIPLKQD